MDMTKTTTPKSTRAFSDMAENSVTQARETYEKMGAATTEAADLIKTTSSTALKGLQDYNNKFLEYAHANSNAAFEFVQKLHGMKSPSEFMELLTRHARTQTEVLTEQSKQLMELAQKVTHATLEPLKAGAQKAFNQAA